MEEQGVEQAMRAPGLGGVGLLRAERRAAAANLASITAAWPQVACPRPLLGDFYRFLPIFTDFPDFLGRLQPRRTRLQKPPNALGVEESSSPRRVLHF